MLLSGSAALRYSQAAKGTGFLRGNRSCPALLKNWKCRDKKKKTNPKLLAPSTTYPPSAPFELVVLVLTMLWKAETLEIIQLLQRQPWHF